MEETMTQEIPKMELTSLNVQEDQLAKLKAVFPEVFNENQVDWDKLRRTLGEAIDTGDERYGMNWPGKSNCFRAIQESSIGALKPCKEESENWDTTENLFIEGDNLEVLKLLQQAYYGKVKMIYIDPPYNTGKEFIYPDKYAESLQTYLAYTGQVDDQGYKFSTNIESDGRFHSKWLNMIYPRLFLSKNLLRDDGVIFISISQRELDNLIKVCNEIFGEENLVGVVTWKARVKPVNIGEAKYRPQGETEYVVIYQKTGKEGKFRPLLSGGVRSYPNVLNDRKYRLTTILKSNRGVNYRSTMSFELEGYTPPDGQRWQAGEDVIKQLYADGYIEFKDGTPFRRYFEDEEGAEHDPFYCFLEVEWSSTSEAGKHELNSLVGNDHGFDTVKPTRLIKTLIQSCTDQDEDTLILDFFAGSATTADAIFQLNAQDGGKRKFICVQLPEPVDHPRYKTIADLSKDRIKKAMSKIKEANTDLDEKLDFGIRVFKLDQSNFKIWNSNAEESDVNKQIEMFIENIDPDSSDEDILFEILSKAGFELTTKIEQLELSGKHVYSIGGDTLLICLERQLTKEAITAMATRQPARVVCLDAGFDGNDQLKTNAVQIMKSHGVTDFRTV